VQTVRLVKQSSYQIDRVYGGQVDHRRQSQLGFEFSGIVAKVNVDEGDQVSKGATIMSLEDAAMQAQLRGAMSNVASARANLTAQKAQLKLSRATLNRYEDLVKTGHASAQRLDELRMQYQVDQSKILVMQTQLQSAEASANVIEVNLDKLTTKAPYDAIVLSRMVDEGSIISPGQPAIVLVEDGPSEARIGVPESMVEYLQSDRSYPFKVGERAVPGVLKSILPSVDNNTGTITALFELEDKRLFGGSLTEMTLAVEVEESGFWVPLNALAESQRGLWSVLAVENNIVESRLVEILYRGSDEVYVRGTITDGDLIVASGTSRIVPGQTVTIAGTGK